MKKDIGKFLLLIGLPYLAGRSCIKFHEIAWGTGLWLGEYSLKWGLIFFVYTVACIAMVFFTGFVLWRIEKIQFILENMIRLRERLGNARWLPALFFLTAPVWVLQPSGWGIVFRDMSIRGMFWLVAVFGFAFLATKEDNIIGWKEFLAAILLTSSEFIIAASL